MARSGSSLSNCKSSAFMPLPPPAARRRPGDGRIRPGSRRCRSVPLGACAPSAAAARRAACAGQHRHRRGDRAHLRHVAVAMQDHVAASRDRRAAALRQASRTMRPWRYRRSSEGPRKPIESRITSRTIVGEVVAGATGSMALNTTWAVMRQRQTRQAAEKRQNRYASRVARSALTTGRLCGCRPSRGRGRGCA